MTMRANRRPPLEPGEEILGVREDSHRAASSAQFSTGGRPQLPVLHAAHRVHEQLQAVREGTLLSFHAKRHRGAGQRLVLAVASQPGASQDPQTQGLLEHHRPRTGSEPADGFPHLP